MTHSHKIHREKEGKVMKKKLVLLLLSGIVCFPLSACGKPSPEAQEVIDEIDSIGDVTLDDESLISQIEDDYLELTDDQQKEVKNFDVLVESKDEIDELYAKEVIDNIDSIGTVDLDDEELIGQIEKQYNSLSDSQKEKVSNISTFYDAKDELEELIAANPIPFCSANWETTQNELKKMLGTPEKEYDNEYYGHILLYSNVELYGFKGDTKYGFENGKLTRVFFTVNEYDETMIEFFENMFTEKYGEPAYQDNYGNKRWETDTCFYTISSMTFSGGIVDITYISPYLGGN